MSRKVVYAENFDRMVKLGIIDPDGDPTFDTWMKIENPPYMRLSLDLLSVSRDEIVIAMAHNFIQNGDVMADPDMEIKIIPSMKMVEALTYRLDSLGINQRVYPEPGRYDPKLKKETNRFLNQWLKNLLDQGFATGEITSG
ncbi:DUF1249 domain-containing protein [Candidatus Dependentiae bacterium]|nr:DUF1249 domain-containing protein [Candidatus Dependentiae bacterium]